MESEVNDYVITLYNLQHTVDNIKDIPGNQIINVIEQIIDLDAHDTIDLCNIISNVRYFPEEIRYDIFEKVLNSEEFYLDVISNVADNIKYFSENVRYDVFDDCYEFILSEMDKGVKSSCLFLDYFINNIEYFALEQKHEILCKIENAKLKYYEHLKKEFCFSDDGKYFYF